MGLGESIERGLNAYRQWRLMRLPGPLGEFHRGGGQAMLLRGMELGADDIALDVGGYVGDWAAEMLCRFGCRVIVLEPMAPALLALNARFGQNQRITIIEAGLAGSDKPLAMSVAADSSSAFRTGQAQQTTTVPMKGVAALFKELSPSTIGCMKLNIEGGEYEVLETMLAEDLLRTTRYLLIQFHEIDANSRERHRLIQEGLSAQFVKEFDYPFAWERWKRKES